QAEDGIRYLYVTGVQTCALPILRLDALARNKARVHTARIKSPGVLSEPYGRVLCCGRARPGAAGRFLRRLDHPRHRRPVQGRARSEERRVGKEARTAR